MSELGSTLSHFDPAECFARVRARALALALDPLAYGWDWGSGLLGHAFLKLHDRGDAAATAWLTRWTDRNLDAGTSIHDPGGVLWSLGAGEAAAALYAATGSARYRAALEAFLAHAESAARTRDGAIASKAGTEELWVDSLMTLCPLLVRAAAVLQRAELLDAAAVQLRLHARRLFEPERGLWRHAFDTARGMPLGQYWSRGAGWAFLAFVEVLPALPPGHPERAALAETFAQSVSGLLACQLEGGGWPTLLDRPETFVESSGQALLSYALARSVREGLLPAELFEAARAAAGRGMAAAAAFVSEAGELTGVSAGTSATEMEHYVTRKVGTWPVWGVAAGVLVGGEAGELKSSEGRLMVE